MDPKEQIKSKIDIVPFISEFIPLRQMGRNFKALCPFHGEKTPSFVVSPERQIWHCFGCGKGGDIFTFLMEYEKLDFVEALRELAKRTGVKLTTLTPSKTEQAKERLYQINHFASEFYHYILTQHKIGEKARSYLAKRGIKKQTIAAFKLGFAPAKWELLVDYLTKKKAFTPEEIEQAGLIVRSQKLEVRSQYYDRFRNRIMFTLRDHRGNVVGFAGRLLDENVNEAKYVNTPETALYHKGELFYGLDVTKEAIKKENQAIIVEGEFDMLSSFQQGVANVVAVKGTALTLSQAKLIGRFTQNIALAFDVDLAGDAASRRAIESAGSEGLNIKVIRVKDGKDPDEVIQKSGIGGWKKAVKDAVSVYDFIIDSALARFDPGAPEGKRAISDEVLPLLSAITNEIVKAHFVKRLAGDLGASEEVVARQMEKVAKPTSPFTSQPSVKPAQRNRQDILEEYLVALLLQKGSALLCEHIADEEDLIQSPSLKKVIEHLALFFRKRESFTISDFVKEVPRELLPTVDRLYLLDTEHVHSENVSSEVERSLRELRVMLLRQKMAKIAEDLKTGEKKGDDRKVTTLKEQFMLMSSQLHKLTMPESSAN